MNATTAQFFIFLRRAIFPRPSSGWNVAKYLKQEEQATHDSSGDDPPLTRTQHQV